MKNFNKIPEPIAIITEKGDMIITGVIANNVIGAIQIIAHPNEVYILSLN
jgi:hypothetical protein